MIYNPSWVRSLYFCFAIPVTGGNFRTVNECFLVEIKACGCKSIDIIVEGVSMEDIFGFICVSLGMQTFSSIGGNEASVSRQMRCSRLT